MAELNIDGMTIAPGVVETIISLAARDVDGVASIGDPATNGIRSLIGGGKPSYRAHSAITDEIIVQKQCFCKRGKDRQSDEKRTILSGIHAYYEPEELIGKTCVAITNLPPRAMMGIESCGMLISALHKENGEERLHLLMVDPHIPAGAKLY